MTLCEVEVFGQQKDQEELPYEKTNLAYKRRTWQWKTYDTQFIADRAVDGNYNADIYHDSGPCAW